MGKSTVCVCGHAADYHRGGKGPCYVCACTVFASHKPRTTEAEQLRLFELQAHERARIYDALTAQGARGATYEEVARATGILPTSVRGRLAEMAAEGAVVRTDTRREVASGREAGVYVTDAYARAGRVAAIRASLRSKGVPA